LHGIRGFFFLFENPTCAEPEVLTAIVLLAKSLKVINILEKLLLKTKTPIRRGPNLNPDLI